MTDGAVRLRVEGRVQGVGFRWFVRESARRLGLAGTVRNLEDGAVEIDASGPPDALGALERGVREGPPGASVAAVHVTSLGSGRPLPSPFQVLR